MFTYTFVLAYGSHSRSHAVMPMWKRNEKKKHTHTVEKNSNCNKMSDRWPLHTQSSISYIYIVSHTIGTDKSTDLFVFPIHRSVLGRLDEHSSLTTSKRTHWLIHQRIFIFCSDFFFICLLFHFVRLLFESLSLCHCVSIFLPIFLHLLWISCVCVCECVCGKLL